MTLLDYGAGNVRSVRNAIKKLGWTIKDVSSGWSRACTLRVDNLWMVHLSTVEKAETTAQLAAAFGPGR